MRDGVVCEYRTCDDPFEKLKQDPAVLCGTSQDAFCGRKLQGRDKNQAKRVKDR
jgi:hypothetical protein